MRNLFTKKQPDLPRRRVALRDANSVGSPADIFRRNRTLTGTTSNVLGIVNLKSDLESSRSKVHHLSNHRRKMSVILVIVVASVVVLWMLLSNFTAGVRVIVPVANVSKSIDFTRYEKTIQEYLDNNPASRLQFFLDQAALNVYVISKLPEVLSVEQRGMADIGQTNFAVVMRAPVAGWTVNNKQYYVDSKGLSFEVNCFESPLVQIVDNSGASPTGSTAIVSNRFLGFVGRVVSIAKDNGYIVSQAILPANTTRELDIKIKDNNTLVKLSIDRPAGEQVEDMSRAIKYFATKGLDPEYMDVRVSNKAFYK